MSNICFSLIEKLHTFKQTELMLLFHLLPLADSHNMIKNISYRDVVESTGMSPQSFYSSLRSLCERNYIYTDTCEIKITENGIERKFNKSNTGYYSIVINSNVNEANTTGYINLNRKFFKSEKWKKLTPNAKWLVLMFLKNTSAHAGISHHKNIAEFYEEMKILLKRTFRQIRSYLHEIKTLFTVTRKNGNYYIKRNNEIKELLSDENKIHSNQEFPYRKQLITGALRQVDLIDATSDKDMKDLLSLFNSNYLKLAADLKSDLGSIIYNSIIKYSKEPHIKFSPARVRQFVKQELGLATL